MRDSGVLRLSSSLPSSAWSPAVSTRPPTTPSWSAMLTSGRTCTPTLSCLEAPPCTPVLLTACRRRSPPSLPPLSRSRSLLLLRGSTLSGLVAPSFHPSLPSNRCGSPSKNTTSAAPPLFTGSASKWAKCFDYFCLSFANQLEYYRIDNIPDTFYNNYSFCVLHSSWMIWSDLGF